MRALLIALIFTNALYAQDFIQEDKKQHAVAGLVIYLGCIVTGEILKKNDVTDVVNSKTCVLASIGAGAAKEIYDYNTDGHVADFSDFTATAITPMLISYTLEF